MKNVADVDLELLWACAPPEALRRTASLAQRMLKGTVSAIHVPSADHKVVRSAPSSESLVEQPTAVATRDDDHQSCISVPIRLPCERDVGLLRVSAAPPRVWNDDDRDILLGLAAQLGCQIELGFEISRRIEAENALDDKRASLLTVADRIPGLIFERRKLDAGRSSYTFFGSGKTGLPAVRQMMEAGIAGLNFVHRDDREAVRAAILRSNLEETDLDLTFRVKDFDRKIRWVRSQSMVRRNADGTVCWDGLCFDITDLVTARETAEAARTSNETLLLNISRELQNPLRAMTGLSHLMRKETSHELFAAHAHTIQVAAESMLDTLDHLLDQARGTPVGAEPPPARSVVIENTAAQTGARILLADDLDLNRKLIGDMLSFEGHVVDCVSDGAEAVRAVGRQAYDLILMDMIMPGMDGVTATRAIRALPKPHCNVPIVALTANAERDQLDGCLEAGMNATLTKPMSMESLTTAVAQWIRSRKAA